jgi:hypothetical protein
MVAFWISTAGREMRYAYGETLFTGLIQPLVTIALGLSVWIGIPLFLFILLIALPRVCCMTFCGSWCDFRFLPITTSTT